MLVYVYALILLATAGTSGGKSAGTELIVSPQGELSSISRAIGLANDGDTIKVKNGVYKERIVVDKSIKLIGIDKPSIDGQGKGTVVLIKAPKCTFKGFLKK